jgi:hypothetical protein
MSKNAPAQPASSIAPRLALVALVIALVGAAAYIYSLQGSTPAQRAAAPPAAPAAAPNATLAPAAAPAGDVLTAAQQKAMIDLLSAVPAGERKAWFQIQANNETTAGVQAAFQKAFEQAGWTTQTVRRPYPVKAGVFLLAADETPPAVVEMVNNAFAAAGLEVQYLTGYRAFFNDRKQNNPNWVGPELAADQPFVIVIGSRPNPKAPAP